MQVQNQKDVEIVIVMSYLIELQLSMKCYNHYIWDCIY